MESECGDGVIDGLCRCSRAAPAGMACRVEPILAKVWVASLFSQAHGGDHILQSGHTSARRGSDMLPCWGRSNVLMRPNFLSRTVWRARLEMLSKRVALNLEPPRNSMSSKPWNSELTQLLLGAHARPKGRFLDRSRKRSGNPMLRQIGCLKAAATISA
jgi:hypothetical protein